MTQSSATTRGCELGGTGRSRAPGPRSGWCAARRRPAGRRAPRRSGRSRRGPCAVARQHEQREGHDREPAELQHRAQPEVGHPPPAQDRAVLCRSGSRSARATGAKTSGSATISATSQAGTPSSTIITRFSVPISSTDRHADRDLEQRQPQQAAERQLGGRRVGERQEPVPSCDPAASRRRSSPSCAAQLQRLGGVEAAAPARSAPGASRRAPAPPTSRRRSARWPPARSPAPGRRAGTAGRPHASTASSGVRGAKVKRIERSARAARPATRPHDVGGDVVDQRVHGDDMVEAAERRVQHVADPELDLAGAESAGDALARRGRPASARGRWPRPRRRAAPPRPRGRRCRSPHRGCARRAGPPAARTAGWRASRRGRPARWRGCGRPARPRSAATRPRPRCGRSRSELAAAGSRRWRSCISRTPAGRRCRGPSSACASAARCRPRGWRRGADTRSAPPRARASGSISNSVDFFSRLRADDVEVGEVGDASPGRRAALKRSISSVSALRLAMTPPSRTL